jgi:SAM-dependent methyltransferase
VRLEIGAGNPGINQGPRPLEDWIHQDLNPAEHIELVCDFGNIPLDDATVDEIFIGDVVEHIPQWRYEAVLPEWHRLLVPGGILRGRCPNIERVMRDFAEDKLSWHDALQGIYGSGEVPWQVHYNGFSPTSLEQLLNQYGFIDFDYSESPGPAERPWWLVFSARKDIHGTP